MSPPTRPDGAPPHAEPAPRPASAPAEAGGPKLHPKYAAQLTAPAPTAADAPSDPRAESTRGVLGLFIKSARAAQLYPRQSKIRRDMIADFATSLVTHLASHGETVLEIRQLEIRAFGEVVYEDANRQRNLAFRLFANGVRGVTFEPGLPSAEAEGVVDVLTIAFRPDASAEEIQTAVWEREFRHAKFEISEDAFTSGEAEEFAGFLQETEQDPASAESARDAADEVWDALGALPATGDPWAPFTAADAATLAERVRAEVGRDLVGETAGLFLDALRAGEADAVRGPLEEFFEHLIASGDVIRAARTLATLRRVAGESRDPAAARALADVVERIGKSKIVPALAPLAESLADCDREGLTMLLTALGEGAVAPLCQMLGTPAHALAAEALEALAPRHLRALTAFVQDTRPEVVKTVVAMISRHAGRDGVAALLPALHHADASVRRDALRAVSAAGGPQTSDLLLSMLDDPVYEIRATALDSLGAARDPRVVAALIARAERATSSSQSFERRELFRALGRIGSAEATSWLAKTLSTTSFFRREQQDEVRCLAASALALAGNAGSRAVLAKHAEDRSEPVRRAVQAAIREAEKRAASAPARPAGPARQV